MLRNQYVLIKSFSDGSGVIQAFGPFETHARAENVEGEVKALADSNSEFRWEIAPFYSLGG